MLGVAINGDISKTPGFCKPRGLAKTVRDAYSTRSVYMTQFLSGSYVEYSRCVIIYKADALTPIHNIFFCFYPNEDE